MVQIAPAHARRLHLDDDLVRPRRRIGEGHQFELAITGEHDAAHGFLPEKLVRLARASGCTECPASRAAFTVSRPIPLLAPMIRTVATASCSWSARLARRDVRCRQLCRKM